MRAHADAACRHLIVNERKEAGASLPHTHAQLYALHFVPAAVAREREHFGAYAVRTMGGNLLADLVQEEVRRRERIVAIDDEAVLMAPYASRVPFHLLLAPAPHPSALRGRGPVRRGAAARRAAAAARPARRQPAAEPVGADRAERRRALLLADRDPAAAHAPGRARARHRREPVHPPAGAGRGGAARALRALVQRVSRAQRHRRRRRHGRDRPGPAGAARRHPHRHRGRRRQARRQGPRRCASSRTRTAR